MGQNNTKTVIMQERTMVDDNELHNNYGDAKGMQLLTVNYKTS